jgi:hypothetical protein
VLDDRADRERVNRLRREIRQAWWMIGVSLAGLVAIAVWADVR